MKAKLLFAGALALIFLACGQKPQSEGYTITGEIAGVTGKVYLTLFEGKMPQRIDSTEVVNGTFSFTGWLRSIRPNTERSCVSSSRTVPLRSQVRPMPRIGSAY